MKEKVLVGWSGGKDSALALYEIKQNPELEISALLTTLTLPYDRISMHGVRRVLLEKQAASLGYPLEKVFIPADCSNQEYEAKMQETLESYQKAGVGTVIFGDIFLADLRKYREANLAKIGMQALFPLWQRDTKLLAEKFIKLGFKAVITCIDSNFLDKSLAGRQFDSKFLSELPPGVDPCGEKGEFHSFVYQGPIFKAKISHSPGETVLRENRFYYRDLLPLS